MKKIIAFMCIVVLCAFICACGAGSSSGESHSLGDVIETDILRITLNRAQLAIRLDGSGWSDGTLSEDYFTAAEYDPEKHAGLAYVASKGHTYVAIEYKVENLDRSSVEFDGTFNYDLISVKYNNKTYKTETEYGCTSTNGKEWTRYTSSNVLLLAGEKDYYRCYVDIPTDANSLNDEFSLIFHVPNSDGKIQEFEYLIPAK